MSWYDTHTRRPLSIEEDINFKFGAWFRTRPSFPPISAAKFALVTLYSAENLQARPWPKDFPYKEFDQGIDTEELAKTTPTPARFAKQEWPNAEQVDSPLLVAVEEHYAQYWLPLKVKLEEQRALGNNWHTMPDATYQLALDFDATFLQPLRRILYDRAMSPINMYCGPSRKELIFGCLWRNQDQINKGAKKLVFQMRACPMDEEAEVNRQSWLEYQALSCYSESVLDYYNQWWRDTPEEKARQREERKKRIEDENYIFWLVVACLSLAFLKTCLDAARWPKTDLECFTICRILVDWSPFPHAPQSSTLLATLFGCVILAATTPYFLRRLPPCFLARIKRCMPFVLAGFANILFATFLFVAAGKALGEVLATVCSVILDLFIAIGGSYIVAKALEYREWDFIAMVAAMVVTPTSLVSLTTYLRKRPEEELSVGFLAFHFIKLSILALLALIFLIYAIVDHQACVNDPELDYEDSVLYKLGF